MIALLSACAGPTTGATPQTPPVVSSGPPPHAVWTEGLGELLGHSVHVSRCGPTGGATVAAADSSGGAFDHQGADTYLFDVDSPSGPAPDVARAELEVSDDAEAPYAPWGFVGDVDGDGIEDWAMVGGIPTGISLVSTDVGSGPADTAGWGDLSDIGYPLAGCAEDFDGDGVRDLMVVPVDMGGEFTLWRSPDAALTYSPWVRFTADRFSSYDVHFANLDGSGGTDLVFSQHTFVTVTEFTPDVRLEGLPPQDGLVVAVGDLDGDELDDLVTWEYDTSSLVPLRNAGGGTQWDEVGRIGWDPGRSLDVWVGDVDGDGRGDLVLPQPDVGGSNGVAAQGLVAIFLGPPDGSTRTLADADLVLQDGRLGPFEQFGRALGVADLDGDRRADLVVGASPDDADHVFVERRKPENKHGYLALYLGSELF